MHVSESVGDVGISKIDMVDVCFVELPIATTLELCKSIHSNIR